MGLAVENAALGMFFLDFILHWAFSSSIFLDWAFFFDFCIGYVLRFLCTGHVLHELFALNMFFFDFCIFCIDIFPLDMFFELFGSYPSSTAP